MVARRDAVVRLPPTGPTSVYVGVRANDEADRMRGLVDEDELRAVLSAEARGSVEAAAARRADLAARR